MKTDNHAYRIQTGVLVLFLCSALGCVSAVEETQPTLSPSDFVSRAEILNGEWKKAGTTLEGISPRYYDLPGTRLDGMVDDAFTYFVVHATNLWRYALAGQPAWKDYTVEMTLRVENPAPMKGPRPGQGCVFMNYQWGREAAGSDAAILVRWQNADHNYMVRFSTGYGHVELWKTKGGVVQVKPCPFEPGKDHRVAVTVSGRWLVVVVDGKELIRYADPVEPIDTGRMGVAVRESRVLFSDVRVTPAAAIDAALPAHKPDFHLRDWVGRQYIFDGDEPVGHIAAGRIEEMKFVPGLMPMMTESIQTTWNAIRWKEEQPWELKKEGDCLQIVAHAENPAGAYRGESTITLTYDPAGGYVWDKRAKVIVLKDDLLPKWSLNIGDPFFYQTVAPATAKMPACKTAPNYAIWLRTDGRIGAFPANHDFKNGGGARHEELVVGKGGYWVTTVDDWGAATETPDDNAYLFAGDYCFWGLDQHLAPVVDGDIEAAFTTAYKQKAKSGEIFEGHVRFRAWTPAQVQAALAKAVPPKVENTSVESLKLIAHAEPVNRCDDIVPAVAGDSKVRWLGAYAIDSTRGRGDRACMRIDAKTAKADPPHIRIGSSYRTGPYGGFRYRIGCWVQADEFHGKVTFRADGFVGPNKDAPKPFEQTVLIDGKRDWTFVGFESEFPRSTYYWNFSIIPEGEGTLFVDDLEMTLLE